MFARHATAAATLSDFSYSAAGIFLVGALLWVGQLSAVANVLAALALANLVGICVGLRSSYWRIRLSFRRSVFERYRGMWSDVAWSLFGTTTWNIQGQGLMFVVASVVGPAAYAPIAAAGVLFSPLRPAMSAFVNVFRPDFVKALAERRALHLVIVISGVCVAVICACIAMGAVIWILWPYLDGHIFGAKFADSAMPLIVTLSAIGAVIYLTYTVPLTLVQAAGEFRAVAVATIIGSIVGLGCIAVSLANGAVPWSLAGAAAGELACGIYLSISAYRILRATTCAREPAVKSVAAMEMRA
jgi:O-antigen/teichoic acid export membrane protein